MRGKTYRMDVKRGRRFLFPAAVNLRYRSALVGPSPLEGEGGGDLRAGARIRKVGLWGRAQWPRRRSSLSAADPWSALSLRFAGYA